MNKVKILSWEFLVEATSRAQAINNKSEVGSVRATAPTAEVVEVT